MYSLAIGLAFLLVCVFRYIARSFSFIFRRTYNNLKIKKSRLKVLCWLCQHKTDEDMADVKNHAKIFLPL